MCSLRLEISEFQRQPFPRPTQDSPLMHLPQRLILGKTTLIAALAKAIGKPLTRINLSEQTDLMDLFGSDVPVSDIVRFLIQKMKEEAQKLMGAS
jgi:hypothetical protein